MLAPVVIFAYNRPHHIQQTISALIENKLSSDTEVIIFSDGYKNENDKTDVLMVREYLSQLKDHHPFKALTLHMADKNKGLPCSIIGGVTKVFETYKKVIVLEDDIVTSQGFLKFMNQALDYYEDFQNIWSVTGFVNDNDFLDSYNSDVLLSCRAKSWSWGTWKDRWIKNDWDVKAYQQFKWSMNKRAKFNIPGRDMSSMLDRQQCGKIQSWAIRWCFNQYLNHSYTVLPRKTLIHNIGQDGSGTNCRFLREAGSGSDDMEWNFQPLKYDVSIDRKFALKKKKQIPLWKLAGSYFVYVIFKGKLGI